MMRRVTLRSIAARIGCSKNTVSLALRGNREIPEETRERIRRVAEELGYRPDALFSQLMAQLRLGQSPRFQAKLALANAHWDQDALRNHPTIPTCVTGCEKRATRLGYSFDNFWLRDPELTASRWIRILNARGIKGIILVGMTEQNQLPKEMQPVWDRFPTVAAGMRPRGAALSFSGVDHFQLTTAALEKAVELGYERPALVFDDGIDRLVDRRFSSAMAAGQARLAERNRIPAFAAGQGNPTDLRAFYSWYNRHKPDVIFTLRTDVIHWLERLNVTVPRDLGIIQLEWQAGHPEIAGMNQHHEAAGEAAVDLLVEQLHASAQSGSRAVRSMLISASWNEGASVLRRGALATPQLLAV